MKTIIGLQDKTALPDRCLERAVLRLFRGYLRFTTIKFRIKGIEILGIQFILYNTKGFTETLEVHDFTGTQEADWLADVTVMHQSKNIIIGILDYAM